ncbi:MAG TPA: response regulator [Myxococcota bacterium]|nr:response regulator [Myxococcota bacterium]
MPDAAVRLLLVDDDEPYRTRLARAFRERGLEVAEARSAEAALAVARSFRPERAVLDLRMEDRSGIDLLADLRREHGALDCVVLTGYGSIATALEAVRRGAVDYLTKPADADEILRAFDKREPQPEAPEGDAANVPSLHRVEWEHIQRVLTACGGNVSRAARLLGLHRRTLQRKLATHPPTR